MKTKINGLGCFELHSAKLLNLEYPDIGYGFKVESTLINRDVFYIRNTPPIA